MCFTFSALLRRSDARRRVDAAVMAEGRRGDVMMKSVVVALIGAACWGIAPVFGKLGLRNVHPMDGLTARTVITLSVLVVWVVSTGALKRLKTIGPDGWFHLGMEAFLATLAGDLAYYAALKWGKAGHAAVILSVSPVITAWAAHAFLREPFTTLQIVGIALVAVGVILVGLPVGQ